MQRSDFAHFSFTLEILSPYPKTGMTNSLNSSYSREVYMSFYYFSEVKAMEEQAELKSLKDSSSKEANGKITYLTNATNNAAISDK